MTERILTSEKIEELKADIKRNGGEPVSENLEELENYLQKNRDNTSYLDN